MTAALRAAGLTLAAAVLTLLTACGSAAPVDTSEIPLVRPAALTAKDGTQIPMPPQVADTGTPSQRDRYAAQVLVPTKLSVHVPAAAQACSLLTGGLPTKDTVARVAAQEHVPDKDAQRIVYAGTLSWCPKFRAPFDAIAAQGDGGAKGAASTSSSTSSSPTTTSSKSSSSSGSSGSSSDSSDSSSGSSSSGSSKSRSSDSG